MQTHNWDLIKDEYIRTNISFRKLAQKHGVVFSTLSKRAVRENWTEARILMQSLCYEDKRTISNYLVLESKFPNRIIKEMYGWLDKIQEMSKTMELTPDNVSKTVMAWCSVLSAGRAARHWKDEPPERTDQDSGEDGESHSFFKMQGAIDKIYEHDHNKQ